MSLQNLPEMDEATFGALFLAHAGSAPGVERQWKCTVDHYGDYEVTAPTAFEARERALDMCGIQGSIRLHVSVYVEAVRA